MRVLHLWDEFEPQWFDHSFDICRDEGIEAKLLCMRLILPPGKSEADVSYVRKIVPKGPRTDLINRGVERLVGLFDRIRFRRAVVREIRRFQPDLLHVHYGTTGALLASTEAVMQLPFIVSFYGFDISQGMRTPAIRRAYRRLMKRRPLIHVLCDEAGNRAIQLGADPKRVVNANLPLPVERYPNIGMDCDSISRWLIPARFVEKKGHAVLLDAFRRLVDEQPHHRLTCWGGYGDAKPIQTRNEQLGLGESVVVVCNRDQGPFEAAYIAQLRHHDVVLAPSVKAKGGDDEGGPALTAVLAQVAGKPVIFSDFPGSERSVTDGVEGLIVPQGDSMALAKAMITMAADPARAREMGQAGRARALIQFSRTAYRHALLDCYRRLAGSRT